MERSDNNRWHREGGRARERETHLERQGWASFQTRCSQAHTSSLCNDLLSVGILFRSNRLLQRRKKTIQLDFSFVDYLWHCWSSEMVSNTILQGSMFFKNIVRNPPPPPPHTPHAHPNLPHLNKLLVWNNAEKKTEVSDAECRALHCCLVLI